MKIIHIVLGKANPERMNGVNKIAHHMAETLDSMNISVEIWGLVRNTDTISERPYPIQLFRMSGHSFFLTCKLKQALSTLPPQTIIHFHGALIPAYYAISRHLAKNNIGWIVTPHGCLLRKSLQRNFLFKWIYIKIFDIWFLKKARKIHVISKDEKEHIQNLGIHSTTICNIPNGLPERHFQPVSVKIKQDDLVFAYMGRFDSQHKGLSELIDGFYHYKINRMPGSLWLIGDGPDYKALQRRIRFLGLENFIHLMPPVFAEEKKNFFDKMDIFVHLSHWDVMPTSVIEACFHAKPVLITSATGLGSHVRQWQSGIVIDEKSPLVVYSALKNLHDIWQEGKLENLAMNSMTMAKNDFDMTKIALEYYSDLYHSD